MQVVATQKEQKCYYILGWIKQIYYIYCWIMVFVYVEYGEYEEIKYHSYSGEPYVSTESNLAIFFIFLTSMIIMLVFYSITLAFMYNNRAMKILDNINENNSMNKIMDILLKEKPEVLINCVCYHTVISPSNYIDPNGEVKTQYTNVIIRTYNESRKLNIFSYLDISGIFRLKDTSKKYIKLQLGKEITFNDEITLYDIKTIINDLYQRNKNRDSSILIEVNGILLSFQDFYLVRLTNESYCFLQKWVYVIFFILTIDKFYELYLDFMCAEQSFVIKKVVSTRENVLENQKYSQFASGYNIKEENVIYKKNVIGGVNRRMEVVLPTEGEIALSKEYNKYIPQYIMNQDGEIINTNQNLVEDILEIKEENPQYNYENKNNGIPNDEINTNNNTNEMNQPLINSGNNFVELKMIKLNYNQNKNSY